MALLQEWRDYAYRFDDNTKEGQKFWLNYFQVEQGIYKKLLANPSEVVTGTVEELAKKFEEVKTLQELNTENKPTILVFNKIDAFSYTPKEEDDLTPKTKENISLDELKNTWMSKLNENCIFISAHERSNIDEFKALLYQKVKEIHITRFPYNDFIYQIYDENAEEIK